MRLITSLSQKSGAYLLLAREVLIKAQTKSFNMYGQKKGPSKEISQLLRQADDLRRALDSSWVRDVNGRHIPGPEPFYGGSTSRWVGRVRRWMISSRSLTPYAMRLSRK
jgi:hypothetical protein